MLRERLEFPFTLQDEIQRQGCLIVSSDQFCLQELCVDSVVCDGGGVRVGEWSKYRRPDIYSYNSAIAACGAKGEADEARQLLEVRVLRL